MPDPAIIRAMEREDARAIRLAAWSIISEATRSSRGNAAWQNWTPKSTILPEDGKEISLDVLNFRIPTQLLAAEFDEKASASRPTSRPSSHVARAVVADVRYNPAAAAHVLRHSLNERTTLARMLGAGIRNERGVEIPQFDVGSIVVKGVWWPLRATGGGANGHGCVPLWDGHRVAPVDAGIGAPVGNEAGNDFFRWPRRVAVDTGTGPYPAAATVTHRDWRYLEPSNVTEVMSVVPLESFVHFKLTKEHLESKDITGAFEFLWGGPPTTDDYLLLVGLHIAAKEHADWLWMTLWWHDRPNAGEFAELRPTTLADPWDNYLMDVTYMDDTPGFRRRGGRPIYNPYLELAFKNGLISNCISCHQLAAWPDEESTSFSNRVQPGVLADRHAYFDQRLRLDYIWSLRGPRAKGR